MANDGNAGEGVARNNSFPGRNGENPNIQNSNMMIQRQGHDGPAGESVAGNNSYRPGNRENPNIQNSNLMIQGQGQDQEHGRVPYVYNQAAWYLGAASNMLYAQQEYPDPNPPPAMDMNMNMNGYYFNDLGTQYGSDYIHNDYYYHPPIDGFYPLQPQPQLPIQPQPRPQPDYPYPILQPATIMNMNMNGYNDHGYYFNEFDGYYYFYHPPTDGFYPLNPQPQFHVQPQPVLDGAGRRPGSSSRYSSNTLQEAGRARAKGRGTGRVLRDSNYNKNKSLPQVMGNIGELLMRMRINEGESSSQLEGEGRVEPNKHANPDVASREYSNAKFFVIRSYSWENVVSSIKHSVWTSTHRGNQILNAAYTEARADEHSVNAIFLFFSVIL